MKTPVNPEQRMRMLKILLIAAIIFPVLVLGWAYIYQNVWPKKPLIVDRIEDQPGYSTNRWPAPNQ